MQISADLYEFVIKKDRLARRYIVYKDGKEDEEYARQKGIKVYYAYEF